jgi:hypothetical protein
MTRNDTPAARGQNKDKGTEDLQVMAMKAFPTSQETASNLPILY